MIQAHSPVYSLTGTLPVFLAQATDLTGLDDRILAYFAGWIKQNPPLPEISDVLDLILKLIERADQKGKWIEVISLGRGIEKALVVGKRWSAWARVLEIILKASQELGDRTTQGLGITPAWNTQFVPGRCFLRSKFIAAGFGYPGSASRQSRRRDHQTQS